jgi:hypothetical protein
MEWEGIHDAQSAEIEIMPEERPLFDLIPADRRDTMAPLIRGVLSNIHAQIGDDAYAIFCADMKRAYNALEAGDEPTARAILSAYGFNLDILRGMMA